MNCPRCSQESIPAASHCEGCGFSLCSLDEHFGVEPVVLERLIDSAHCLRLKEKEEVEKKLLEFEASFPQLFASVYIGSLPDWTTVAEFGFWLLNRSSITNSEIPRHNRFAIVLVLDPDRRTAGLTVGYSVEQILSEKSLDSTVRKARNAWRSGEYANGITQFLGRLSKHLRKACRRIPEAYRASADRLDTLPPPDISPHPAQPVRSPKTDLLQAGENQPEVADAEGDVDLKLQYIHRSPVPS